MSKLRDLINQSKGNGNGQTSQPVLQSEYKETAIPKEAADKQLAAYKEGLDARNKKPSLLDKFRKPAVVEQGPLKDDALAQISISGSENKLPETKTTTIQEPIEIMPTGLTLMAQMKWKREHATVHLEAPSSPNVPDRPVGNVNSVVPHGEKSPDNNSASQAADAQKTNDGTANIEELKRNLAYLANNIENKDMVKDVVRMIGMQLKNNPELTPLMTRADVNLAVRGFRMAYQVAAMRKQEKADTKKKKDSGTQELAAMFKDAGIDLKLN